ncbi:MAG: MerR family transcriptional regulator [Gammaproteobacteria bacterium]|nr:MerR family transcriptional regulator [Gammaproteobacteria bacterium]
MAPQLNTVDSGLYPIGTVSELTGVNAITLRAWERRYSLFEPVRKASGHRLYTQQHIDLINRIVGLLARGMRIGQVKAHLDAEQARAEDGTGTPQALWRRYLERMVTGVVQFDEAALEETYGEALAVYPVKTVTEELLTPLLMELGRRWEDGEGTVAEEHFFGCYLRSKLGARFHHRVRAQDGPKLLLACLPGDRHETGLLLFALAASDAGYHTIVLGADMPLNELPAATRKTRCAAIVLSGLVAPDTVILKKDLAEAIEQSGVPVFIGGRASVDAYDSLKRAGAEPLGTDLETGLARMSELLNA